MAKKVTFRGQPVKLTGSPLEVGAKAPQFQLVDRQLKAVGLETFGRKKKLLNVFVSLDTPVCSKSIQTFYDRARSIPNLAVLNISMDLPFAAARFCTSGQMEEVVTLSAFRSAFGRDFGVLMGEGALQGLLARAVFVLDEDNRVTYAELVPEITQEPNYAAALESLQPVK